MTTVCLSISKATGDADSVTLEHLQEILAEIIQESLANANVKRATAVHV